MFLLANISHRLAHDPVLDCAVLVPPAGVPQADCVARVGQVRLEPRPTGRVHRLASFRPHKLALFGDIAARRPEPVAPHVCKQTAWLSGISFRGYSVLLRLSHRVYRRN